MRELAIITPGEMAYADAWALQERLHARRVAGEIPDTLILLSHPHVLTVGRRGGKKDLWANMVVDREQLEARGVDFVESDRGGDITYHGPGQLVGYPIISLDDYGRDVRRYVQSLERVMRLALSSLGIESGRDPDNPGVWIGAAKIGAIGARIRKWTTMHGFALNLRGQLEGFDWIVACGLGGRGITSVEREIGVGITDEVAIALVTAAAAAVLDRRAVPTTEAQLLRD